MQEFEQVVAGVRSLAKFSPIGAALIERFANAVRLYCRTANVDIAYAETVNRLEPSLRKEECGRQARLLERSVSEIREASLNLASFADRQHVSAPWIAAVHVRPQLLAESREEWTGEAVFAGIAGELTQLAERLTDGTTGEIDQGIGHAAMNSKTGGEARALALAIEHPDWTDAKIAMEAGVSRTTVYRWKRFKALRNAHRQKQAPRIRRGSKHDGQIEAED